VQTLENVKADQILTVKEPSETAAAVSNTTKGN
jgi:hypothetical protein